MGASGGFRGSTGGAANIGREFVAKLIIRRMPNKKKHLILTSGNKKLCREGYIMTAPSATAWLMAFHHYHGNTQYCFCQYHELTIRGGWGMGRVPVCVWLVGGGRKLYPHLPWWVVKRLYLNLKHKTANHILVSTHDQNSQMI